MLQHCISFQIRRNEKSLHEAGFFEVRLLNGDRHAGCRHGHRAGNTQAHSRGHSPCFHRAPQAGNNRRDLHDPCSGHVDAGNKPAAVLHKPAVACL